MNNTYLVKRIKTQDISNKIGEVIFRKKLIEQHLGLKHHFSGQPDQSQMLQELHKRIQNTKNDFKDLASKKIPLSPFLEIGAEKCQRALFLTNELGLSGFAGDISLESLKSAEKYQKIYKYTKMPIRICLDAYHLPFLNGCLPFVFYYETLHHFPHPEPILKEAHRVVKPNGYVFFGEEPVRQLFNLRLWRRDYHLTPFEKFLKYTLILPFLSTIGKSEVKHNILEETFWLDVWEQSLKKYSRVEAELIPYLIGKKVVVNKVNFAQTGWLKPPLITLLLLAIQGGGIKSLAQVSKNKSRDKFTDKLINLLACPTCRTHPKVKHISRNKLSCNKCHSIYPVINNVYILLSKEKQKRFYDIIEK